LFSRKKLTKRIHREATGYTVGSARTDDGVLASDHRPVFADVAI
jgi:hypothetical protein